MKKLLLKVFDKIRRHFFTSAKVKNKIEQANIRKKNTLALIPTLPALQSRADKNSPKYIVSLTSYGKRLTNTAPYAIVTLFNQNIKPDRIILWVAREDEENIPDTIYELVEKGLEIRFCENIKSYKKLIFSLREFPNDRIITADDDVYYPSDWLEQLIAEHKKNPRKIICHRAKGIKVDKDYKLLPYKKWDDKINPSAYFAG
ncbi:MAG: glycosyltransferase family 2 protein, partial [Chitinivibrionia bacterium]|nr:glycosyltransferase family 2 protein [Chitinivibrionia bacterium]